MSSSSQESDAYHAVKYGNLALSFVDELTGIRTISEMSRAFESAMSQFGFQYFVMAELPSIGQLAPSPPMLAKIPIGWAELYAERGYQSDDPIVRISRRSSRPFAWSEIPGDKAPKGRSLEIMQRARDFGLCEGFALPIHGWNGYSSCVSISATRPPQLDPKTRPAIHLMAMYAFERVRELCVAEAPSQPILSAREREVLTWAAAGKSAAAIAKILNITERTAIAHTVNATHKLGALNKTQAVAKAIQNKLINI